MYKYLVGQSLLKYVIIRSPIRPENNGFGFHIQSRNPKPWFQGFYSFMGTLNWLNQYKIPGGRAFGELFDHHDDQERGLWVDTIIYQQL